jgi:hypothetical protein
MAESSFLFVVQEPRKFSVKSVFFRLRTVEIIESQNSPVLFSRNQFFRFPKGLKRQSRKIFDSFLSIIAKSDSFLRKRIHHDPEKSVVNKKIQRKLTYKVKLAHLVQV